MTKRNSQQAVRIPYSAAHVYCTAAGQTSASYNCLALKLRYGVSFHPMANTDVGTKLKGAAGKAGCSTQACDHQRATVHIWSFRTDPLARPSWSLDIERNQCMTCTYRTHASGHLPAQSRPTCHHSTAHRQILNIHQQTPKSSPADLAQILPWQYQHPLFYVSALVFETVGLTPFTQYAFHTALPYFPALEQLHPTGRLPGALLMAFACFMSLTW